MIKSTDREKVILLAQRDPASRKQILSKLYPGIYPGMFHNGA